MTARKLLLIIVCGLITSAAAYGLSVLLFGAGSGAAVGGAVGGMIAGSQIAWRKSTKSRALTSDASRKQEAE